MRIFRAKKTVLRENTTTIVFLFREDLAGIIAAIEGTIGDGFEHVLLLDVFRAFQIGYRTRDFQYTIIRTRGETQLGHRELQQLVRIGIQGAVLTNHLRVHHCVAMDEFAVLETLGLNSSGTQHALTDSR